jgi:hypothetical protein
MASEPKRKITISMRKAAAPRQIHRGGCCGRKAAAPDNITLRKIF